MGLTTQVLKNIKVASRDKRIITKVGSVAVKAVKSYVDVTADNYYILEILDAIKDFKDISDLNREGALKRLQQKIIELNEDDRRKLINTSLKYPPRVRALTGALLTNLGIDNMMIQPLPSAITVFCCQLPHWVALRLLFELPQAVSKLVTARKYNILFMVLSSVSYKNITIHSQSLNTEMDGNFAATSGSICQIYCYY